MKRKMVLLISFVMLITLMLSACSGGGETSEGIKSDSKYSIMDIPKGSLIVVKEDKTGLYGGIDAAVKLAAPCEYKFLEYIGTGSYGDRYIAVKDGKYGFIDGTGKEVIPFEYDSIQPPSTMEITIPFELTDDLAVVRKNGKEGYCSLKDGEVVIEPQFASANSFDGGEIASVHIDGDHTGYINREGDQVISDKYSEVGVFYDGVATARDENGKTGVIDSEGKTLIPFKYDEIYEYYDNGYAVALEQVSEENYRYIAIDHTGNEILSSDHQIDMFWNLFGEYVTDEYYILYDLKGSKLTDEKFSEVTAMFEGTGIFIYDMDGKAGLLDGDGNILLPCQYSGIDDIFHDDKTGKQLWEVRYGEDGYCKLINEKGEEIPTGKYKEIGQFSDTGLAPVLHEGKVGYIDLTGKEVVPCEYYPATWGSGEPEEGFVLQFSNLYAVRKDGEDHYAIMDENGKVVTDYKYSFVGETTPESESAQEGMSVSGVLVVKDDGEKYGVVGLDGREISPCGSFYAVAESFDNRLILVKRSKDELWCLMDQNGKIVTEPVFDRLFEYALPPEADTSRNKEHHELTESDKDSLLKQVAQTAMPKMYGCYP